MSIGTAIAKLKEHRFFSEFFTYKSLAQFGKYLITGVSSAVLEYSLLIILTEWAGFWYLVSNSIAYMSGFWLSFLLNRFWSFKSKDALLRQLLLYFLLFIINFVLTNALMYLLTDILGILYMISKIFVMGAVVLWNFVLYKKVIYKN